MDQQSNWATQLAKAKQTAKPKPEIPLIIRKKQWEEELAYFKTNLRLAVDNRDWEQSLTHLNNLFVVRARQMVIIFAELEEQSYIVDEEIIELEINNYYRDCQQIATATLKYFN